MNNSLNQLTGFEELENRLLLSGDVGVVLDSGNLSIVGDGLANQIRIVDNNAGGIRVIGLNGTLINGSRAFNSGANAVADVTARMRGAGDTVLFRSDNTTGEVKITTAGGNDRVIVDGDSLVAKRLVINTGTHNDCVRIRDSRVLGGAVIATSAGNDRVIIDTETHINNGLTLKMGTESDRFRAENSTIKGKVAVNLGDGNDREGHFDMLYLGSFFRTGGAGADVLVVEDSRFKRDVTASGGSGTGSDKVIFTNSVFGRTSADSLTVKTGAGNDFVVATDNRFRSDVLFDGGGGAGDNLAESNNKFYAGFSDLNFEGTSTLGNVDVLVNSVQNFQC